MGLAALGKSPSARFAFGAGSFCAGVAVAPLILHVPPAMIVAALLVCVFLCAVSPRRSPPDRMTSVVRAGLRIVFLFAALFFLGAWRYGQILPPSHVPTVADRTGYSVRVSGVAAGALEERFSGGRIVLKDTFVAEEAVWGKVLVSLPEQARVGFGDALTFSCRLRVPEPIETFRYDRQLRSRGILALCLSPEFLTVQQTRESSVIARAQSAILSVRDFIIGRFSLILPEPHASFVSGLLFGGSSTLSKELREDFSQTGASHILAASGFNVSLFTLWFLGFAMATRLGRRGGILVTTIFLIGYVFAAGATAAVVRAALMAALLLVAKWFARKPHPPNLLLAAAALLLWFNPQLLRDDVGFQLSFVAVSAIMLTGERWKTYFDFLPERWRIRESFGASCAAILFTLPIVVWHFGTVSFISILANALVLPFIPVLMFLGLIGLFGSFLSASLGMVASWPALALSSFLLHLIRWFGAVPFGTTTVISAHIVAVLITIGFGAICFYVIRIKKSA